MLDVGFGRLEREERSVNFKSHSLCVAPLAQANENNSIQLNKISEEEILSMIYLAALNSE